MLTLERLKLMKKGEIIATGIVNDERLYNLDVRWVAVKGDIHDWAIYYHTNKGVYWVRNHGNKLVINEVIKELVHCNVDAFKMYRL